MSKPLAERTYDFFISHADVDKPTCVNEFVAWCDRAGLSPFYDVRHLAGHIASGLNENVADSMSGVGFISQNSLDSKACNLEWGHFAQQELDQPDFRVIGFVLDDSMVPDTFRKNRYIDLRGSGFDAEKAAQFVELLHGGTGQVRKFRSRNFRTVYFASGARPHEQENAQKVREAIARADIRVVRDDPRSDRFDHGETMLERVQRIMLTCNGVVAVLPLRNDCETSPYLLMEVLQAVKEELPLMLVVDGHLTTERLSRELERFVRDYAFGPNREPGADQLLAAANRLRAALLERGLEAFGKSCWHVDWTESQEVFNEYLDRFQNELRGRPKSEAKCFFGHRYGRPGDQRYGYARRSIEAVAGMPCLTGDDFRAGAGQGGGQADHVAKVISESSFAILDIADEEGRAAVNTCIEAGIAIGAGVKVHLVAPGVPRQSLPPEEAFMLKHRNIEFYQSELDLIAIAHRIALNYRTISE